MWETGLVFTEMLVCQTNYLLP